MMKARYTPRFGKRFTSLEDGEATLEGMQGSVKLMVQNKKGNQFWVFLDPIELLDAALGAVPLGRLKDASKLEAFKKMLEIEDIFEGGDG
jgi:hypothetical protein